MKKLIITILFINLITNSCNQHSISNGNNVDSNLVSILNDTINIFSDVQEFSIDRDYIENDSIKIVYFSISKDNFFDAMYKNQNKIQFFNRDYKLNEDKEFRNGDKISLKSKKKDSIHLEDLPLTDLKRPISYFMQGRIGDFYIVKKIHFEDVETYFYNAENLNLEKKLWGITSSYQRNKSLVFYSNKFFIYPEEKAQLSFLKTNKNQVKYLLNVEVDWFTSFSFFDDDNNLYYIHCFYDENLEIKSTYAKMEYYLKE